MSEEAKMAMRNLHLKIVVENNLYCSPDELFYVMAILAKNALEKYYEKKGSYKIETTIPLSEDDMQFVYEERIPIEDFAETEFRIIKVMVRRSLERVVEDLAKVDINEYRKQFSLQ